MRCKRLDWERCAGSLSSQGLRLRNWRPGDQYQPQGRAAAEKIKTLFQEYRVPLWERRTWPVVDQSPGQGRLHRLVAEIWSRKRVRRGAGKPEDSDDPRSDGIKAPRLRRLC